MGTSSIPATSVASSATSVTLAAANPGRKGATIFNDDANTLYMKLGPTASLTSYTVKIPQDCYWEMPADLDYTGVIDGIWSAAGVGAARIGEY